MANRATLRVWTRDFSEAALIEQFVRFLAAVPHSEAEKHFTQLMVQPIDSAETPIAEWNLRGENFGPAETVALALQYINSDTAYFVSALWDLWQFDLESMKWRQSPSPLLLACHGPEYDGGIAESEGNFQVDLGFEHLFTGHGGLLRAAGKPALQLAGEAAAPVVLPGAEDPVEHTFIRWMATEDNRREYHRKTRENIQQLFDWMATIERALPVERMELTSEGEENFEARLDEIYGHS
jgi:hypothetical protein